MVNGLSDNYSRLGDIPVAEYYMFYMFEYDMF